MKDCEKTVKEKLYAIQDLEYKDFIYKLTPTLDYDKIIGIRIPNLRKIADELRNTKTAEDFLLCTPHEFFEENTLHIFLLEKIKDFDKAVYEVDRFLQYIDNWSTCDSRSPVAFKKNPDKLFPYIQKWIGADHIYTVRYGVKKLMDYYLDENFSKEHLYLVAKVEQKDYYINMMTAWYYATALAKQYDDTIKIIEQKILPKWTHNKAIQKAKESYRITTEQKEYLNSLKIK